LFVVSLLCTLQVPASMAQSIGGQYSISGKVYDANHKAIPNAKVTLYHTKFILDYVAQDPVKSPDNPQYTSNGSTLPTGYYQFSGLTADVYIVTAEKDGIAYSEKVQLKEGTATLDLAIPGYIEKSYSSSPTPTPRPSPTFTNVIPPVPDKMPDINGIIFGAASLLLMGLVALQLVAGIAIIVLRIGGPK
jgi:hypothetical protein